MQVNGHANDLAIIGIPLGFLGLESGYGRDIKIFAKSSGDFEIFVKGQWLTIMVRSSDTDKVQTQKR